jgi:hypothetical protein
MKTSLSISNILRSLALFIAVFSTAASLKAQEGTPNVPIKINTLPPMVFQQLAIIDTRTIDFPPQVLGAPLNSTISNAFKVPADGKITLSVKLDHKGNAPVNHTVRIELRNPAGAVAASINEFIVKHNEIRTATLSAIATEAQSGCSGANMWSYRIINNDNVNHQATLVDAKAIVPDATGTRSTFPTGAYTLTQNQFGDYVFRTPKGHNGGIRITVTYGGGTNVEARLFKPGVEPAPNEANAVVIKNLTASGQTVSRSVSTNDVTATDQFWTVRLRNKSAQTVTNLRVKVEFTDCTEQMN